MNLANRRRKIPKKIISKPNVTDLIAFLIIVIAWVSPTLTFFAPCVNTFQFGWALLLTPAAVTVGLRASYDSGIYVAKINYKKVIKDELFTLWGVLLLIQIACIIACIICEIIIAGGYPIEMCFNACCTVEMVTVIKAYTSVTTFMFLPAYWAIPRYGNFVQKYGLENPCKKPTKS